MRSYFLEKQSRGVGAIAADDLEDLADTRQLETEPPLPVRRGPKGRPRPAPSARPRPATTDRPGPILTARIRPGEEGRRWHPARGTPLPPPTKRTRVHFARPSIPSPSAPNIVGPSDGSEYTMMPIVERPVSTKPAGLMPGVPSKTLPVKKTLQTQVMEDQEAKDRAMEMDEAEQELHMLPVPAAPSVEADSKSSVTPILVVGGIGLALYLLMK